ncbi:flagellar biosynthetic protein FliR [Pseudoroseicyclus sp. CLL3-39]|uniref:Flagellar biosynthetic protein FliR n=2 Tax=Pseudoroseicyclus tamaricis TaxID=2705421 RepID=A0A6B2K6K5_9RHOB|nr:flagellar biosynthetic protein FliR [Pseudoroseicyclus tamaricis]
MWLMPAFGEQSVPMRVKTALAFAFTAICLPAVAGLYGPGPAGAAGWVRAAGAEVAAGLIFGFGLRFFTFALQIAGTIAAQSVSLSQIFGAGAGEPQPVIGHIFTISALALAAILGLHVQLAAYLILSWEMMPPGALPGGALVAQIGLQEAGRMMATAFSLSAPFVLAGLAYQVVLGVINRAMPQLMVTFVGAPAATAGGLILLFAVSPLLLSLWADALFTFLGDPFGGAP